MPGSVDAMDIAIIAEAYVEREADVEEADAKESSENKNWILSSVSIRLCGASFSSSYAISSKPENEIHKRQNRLQKNSKRNCLNCTYDHWERLACHQVIALVHLKVLEILSLKIFGHLFSLIYESIDIWNFICVFSCSNFILHKALSIMN